jgi:hypothetical protein
MIQNTGNIVVIIALVNYVEEIGRGENFPNPRRVRKSLDKEGGRKG